jgi:hypothetical protein
MALKGERKGKEDDRVNNIEMLYMSAGRGHNALTLELKMKHRSVK